MSKVKSPTDAQLFELVRHARPISVSERAVIEAGATGDQASRLLQQIITSQRDGVSGSRAPVWRPRRLAWTAMSVCSVAAIAVAAALLFSAGGRPSVAFAGWQAAPTAPASGQVQVAQSECRRNKSLTTSTPTLTDTRGPYTLLVYATAQGGVCVTGPSLLSPTGEPPVAPFHELSLAKAVVPDAIERIDNAAVTVRGPQPGSMLSFNDGRVGSAVSGVTLVLKDGSRVVATVANGWFAAWWPGAQAAQSAEITTNAGEHAQQLIPAPGYETSAASPGR